MQLAAHVGQGLAGGEPSNIAIKAATIKQLTAILGLACARPGFLTVNRHLTEEELAGLGWQILQPLVDNPRRGEDALATAISALVTFSCACKLCTAELANLLLQMCASTVLSMSVKVGRLRSREAIAIE